MKENEENFVKGDTLTITHDGIGVTDAEGKDVTETYEKSAKGAIGKDAMVNNPEHLERIYKQYGLKELPEVIQKLYLEWVPYRDHHNDDSQKNMHVEVFNRKYPDHKANSYDEIFPKLLRIHHGIDISAYEELLIESMEEAEHKCTEECS